MKDEYMEKRKSRRVEVHIPMKYYKVGDYGPRVRKTATVTGNLCEGGIRFTTTEFISRACRLIVTMNVPKFKKPIKAISKVAWIRKTDPGGNYEIGNHFLEMSAEDKKRILDYVSSFTPEN